MPKENLEILESAPETAAEITLGSIALSVVLLLLFAWLADRVALQHTLRFDFSVRNWIHQFASPTMTTIMRAFSILGGQILTVLAILVPGIFWFTGQRRAASWMAITMIGALVLDLTLKYAFHRPRPVPFFGVVPHTYSFPSGHSLFSFCFFGTLAGLLSSRTTSLSLRVALHTVAALLILCIGLSRIYLGVHYPTDVIAGYLAAAVWVSTVVLLDRYRRRRTARE